MKDILKTIIASLPSACIALLMPEHTGFIFGLFIYISFITSIINSIVLLER